MSVRAVSSVAQARTALSNVIDNVIDTDLRARLCSPRVPPRVTIGDVATEAGVSIATVSKVINDRYGVAQDTLEPGQGGDRRSRLRVDPRARSMRSRRTNVIGILVADIEPFSAELLKGAARAIRQTGYELIVYSGSGHGREHSGWERRNVSRLSGTITDGIILVTPTVVDVIDDAPVVAVDPHAGPPTLAQRARRQPRRRRDRDGVPHRPRPPPHRLPRRSPRPGVRPAARAGLPRRAGRRRHRPRPGARPRRRVRAGVLGAAGPPAAPARRSTDGDLRRQRPVGHPDDARRPLARTVRARRCVGGRLRQHPRVGAHRAAADDDRPVVQQMGRRPCGCSSTCSTAGPNARSRSPCRPASSSASPAAPSTDERDRHRRRRRGVPGSGRSPSANGSPTCSLA